MPRPPCSASQGGQFRPPQHKWFWLLSDSGYFPLCHTGTYVLRGWQHSILTHLWRILLHSYAHGQAVSAVDVAGKSAMKHDQIAGDVVALERAVFIVSVSNGEGETSVDLALAIVQSR